MKYIFYYAEEYLFTFPLSILHEYSHLLIGFITFCMGLNSFPIIVIDRFMSVKTNADDTITVTSNYMYVTYNCKWNKDTDGHLRLRGLIASGPLWLVIWLFCSLPWYLYPIVLCNLSSVCLSVSDITQVKLAILTFKKQKA